MLNKGTMQFIDLQRRVYSATLFIEPRNSGYRIPLA
jgi:hypothetical protein